ncbi:MarR family winged helix-turn-helix transcriptional regulator [Pseudodesulfovibrio sp.]|uniref:MarR family winged helix-turn-helix transcriptional regulator n=1 Tax=unclassified Pseudodesulfovibrio TaxID=2661612 RepID=UPI003B00FF72
MTDDQHLTHLFVEFHEKLSSWEASVVEGKGLTTTQMHTLEILGVHGPLRMKELADRLGVTTGSLTIQADRLEKKDLVRRVPHPTDRRSNVIEMTSTGKTLFEEHNRLHLELTREITAGLDEEQREALGCCLDKIIESF